VPHLIPLTTTRLPTNNGNFLDSIVDREDVANEYEHRSIRFYVFVSATDGIADIERDLSVFVARNRKGNNDLRSLVTYKYDVM
jgi:hypothetical protein